MKKSVKKKIIVGMLALAAAAAVQPGVFAANEVWRDAFVTRLMREIAQDPTYTDVVLTDLDRNGVPEAFVIKKGTYGNIGAAFTMSGGTITEITVPQNIIGECLENIDVYIKNENYVFVGQEIPRYSSYIAYYKLELEGSELKATRINKSDVSPFTPVTYVDKYSSNLLENGYPNRTKIDAFISSYDVVNSLSAEPSSAQVLVNGSPTAIAGYTVNDTNYFKIRDVAMVLRNTSCEFNVEWRAEDNGLNILPGSAYVPNGTELASGTLSAVEISSTDIPVYVNGKSTAISAYSINGDSYLKIRDIAEVAGCEVQWDGGAQTINILTE